MPVGATLAVIEPAGAEAPAKLKVVAPKAAPKPEPAPVQVKPVAPPRAARAVASAAYKRRAPDSVKLNPTRAVRDDFLPSC